MLDDRRSESRSSSLPARSDRALTTRPWGPVAAWQLIRTPCRRDQQRSIASGCTLHRGGGSGAGGRWRSGRHAQQPGSKPVLPSLMLLPCCAAEIGVGLTGLGFLFLILGVLFFFDRGLLAMGNVR